MDKNTLPSSHGDASNIEIKDTERNRDFWLAQPQFKVETRESMRAADILIVPEGDDYEGHGAYFPEYTTDFYHFLVNRNISVEIATEQDDFQELVRHEALYTFGEFVLTGVITPVFIGLLLEYLKKRVQNPENDTMEIGFTHQKADGSAKHTNYKGPVKDFESKIQPLFAEFLEESPLLETPVLPPVPDEESQD